MEAEVITGVEYYKGSEHAYDDVQELYVSLNSYVYQLSYGNEESERGQVMEI